VLNKLNNSHKNKTFTDFNNGSLQLNKENYDKIYEEFTEYKSKKKGLWKEDFDPTDGSNYISENYKRNEEQD
jgi:endonuclease YncB( thermonuclease family)